MGNNNQPAFPRIYEFGSSLNNDFENEPGMSKLEYIATHISISDNVDGLPAKALSKLLGKEMPELGSNPQESIEWWAEAEAKVRIIKAKALLSELEKNNL